MTTTRGDIVSLVGVAAFSKTHMRADEPGLGVGGTVIDEWADPETGEILARLVEVWRGKVEYHILPAGDLEPGLSGRNVNTRSIEALLLALGQDGQRRRDPLAHHHAVTVLAGLLVRNTETKGRR